MSNLAVAAIIAFAMPSAAQSIQTDPNPYATLMARASAHARTHGARTPPVLSPNDNSVLNTQVPVAALQRTGVRVIPWTTNDPDKMRAVIGLGVDGLISDRPDLLQKVLAEERAAATPELRRRLEKFDVAGHRGGRGLRPENTLPAFEVGLDNGINTIETDTGVTSDHVSLIWHDQFLNPQSCRRADGAPYTLENRVYIRDISIQEAQKTYLCDQLHFGPDQKNDLALSPVAVAFAKHENLISPYVPTYVEQLFSFTRFYANYYRSGPGKSHPRAAQRALTADRVHFNLETKILPPPSPGKPDPTLPVEMFDNHTVTPQIFVDTLCGAIVRAGMQARSDVQSFDFRTLILVEEQHPDIPTFYLTEDAHILSSEFVPLSLRQRPHDVAPSKP
jgi:glycerophosphoryl diester phosphodiesterase